MANEKRENWIFTFGCGQQYEGYYVKFFGTFGEAREKMCSRFGKSWAFQYSEKEWNSYVQEAEERALRIYGTKKLALIEKELKL